MSELKKDIPVTGMTCAACANRIEKGLQRIDGVTSANVNFATEKAVVSLTMRKSIIPSIQDKIRSLGYDIVKEDVDFQISGMTCAACSARIEKGLARMEGVYSANVNLALETGKVKYDPTLLNAEDFIKKIKSMGYDAELKSDIPEGQEDHRQVEIRNKTLLFLISAAVITSSSLDDGFSLFFYVVDVRAGTAYGSLHSMGACNTRPNWNWLDVLQRRLFFTSQ